MKEILNKLHNHKRLTRTEAKDILIRISNREFNDAHITSFMTVFQMRPISVDELAGFREALLELCIPIDFGDIQSIDMCGTGGDGKNTFNISTLASFIVAGAGYKVTKHGNYGVSSKCGSSNVLENLGYTFTDDKSILQGQLDQFNICFLHAPLFHPAMAAVAPIRRELKMKTFFNMLGPIVNPARPTHQLVGVFSVELARLYQYLFQKEEKRYAIIYGMDGYDEISLTDKFILRNNKGEFMLEPRDLNLELINPRELYGGETVEDSAAIFRSILQGNGTKIQNEVVLANAGMAIKVFKPNASWEDCYREAKNSLENGNALASLNGVVS